MKKLPAFIVFFFFFALACLSFYSWKKKQLITGHYKSFSEWYKKNIGAKNNVPFSKPRIYTCEYLSIPLHIDTIFRSMQGPLSSRPLRLETGSFIKGPELYWLVGYAVDIVDADGEKKLSDDFMCHNNLDLLDKTKLPWELNTEGTFSRLFTLTEGQTKTLLPDGFGIPLISNQSVVVNSQVLNHNCKNINVYVRHKVTIYYVKESELAFEMKPLYQQAVFVTKFVSGPPGNHNEPVNVFEKKDSVIGNTIAVSVIEDTCCTGKVANGDYNPYKDNYGRTFTGHWKFNPGREVLATDVTRMLNLHYDTRVHYIGVHVHPFCTSLELVDATEGKTIFKALTQNFPDRIGLKSIAHFSSEEGVMMYRSHQYRLISTYDNPTQDVHTAMATMFLYLEDREI